MVSLSGDGRADVVDAFGTTSGCLNGVLGIDSVCFGGVGNKNTLLGSNWAFFFGLAFVSFW